MKTMSNVKNDARNPSHNQNSATLKVQTQIKAGPGPGGVWLNHNQTAATLKVQTMAERVAL